MQTAADYKRVFDLGRRFKTDVLRINFLPNEREYSRLGLIVSRRHGKSWQRSRTKRLLRTCFRKAKYDLVVPHDIILLPSGAPASLEEYCASFAQFTRRLRATAEGGDRR